MMIIRSLLLILSAFADIGGAWLIWQGIANTNPPWYAAAGVAPGMELPLTSSSATRSAAEPRANPRAVAGPEMWRRQRSSLAILVSVKLAEALALRAVGQTLPRAEAMGSGN